MKVGIPRALLYYEYFPLWETFFNDLGAQTIISGQSTRTILNNGILYCINEACLPVKAFHGHVIYLKDKVDILFIPRIKSMARREYICPKFTGLPDMIKSSIPDLPKIIDTEINLHKSNAQLEKAFLEIGLYITEDELKIQRAYYHGLREQERYLEKLQEKLLPVEKPETKGLRIAVLGHAYNLYDSYVNNNIFKKLHDNNVEIITPEMLCQETIFEHADGLNKRVFWSFAKKTMGSTLHFIKEKNVDGVIYIMSFGCGIDSFIADLCERRLRRDSNIPFYLLILDEHSGEAGMNTRIEAFIDMLNWRKQDGNNISTYG